MIKREYTKGRENINWGGKFILGVSISTIAIIFTCIFLYPSYETSDDFLIYSIFSGIYGESSPYTLVLSVPLGIVLTYMQTHFPILNWLTVLEIFSIWVSFSVFQMIISNKKGKIGTAISSILLFILEISFTTKLNYTRTACLFVAAGMILLLVKFSEKRKSLVVILGLILVVLGICVRKACVYLVLPFCAIYILKPYIKKNPFECVCWKNIKYSIRIAVLLCIVVGIQFFIGEVNAYMNARDSDMTDYIEYNSKRARAMDYIPASYEEYQNEYMKNGISPNDFYMVKSNMIYDGEFGVSFYERFLDIDQNAQVNSFWDKIKNIEWKNDICHYKQGRRSTKLNIFPIFALVFLVSLFFANRNNLYIILANGLTVMGLSFYFVYTGRFPPWIQDSLFLLGIVGILYENEYMSSFKRNIKNLQYLACLITIISGCYIGQMYLNDEKEMAEIMQIDTSVYSYMEYMQMHKESVFLIDNFSKCPFPIMDAYGTIHGMNIDSWSNIVRVGNWYIGHPVLRKQLQDLEIESPLYSLTQENVYLLTNVDSYNLSVYSQFFLEHYNLNTSYTLVERWGDYGLYSYGVY